jgi:hypothetical protein
MTRRVPRSCTVRALTNIVVGMGACQKAAPPAPATQLSLYREVRQAELTFGPTHIVRGAPRGRTDVRPYVHHSYAEIVRRAQP